jgi:hypothetical protein
MLNPYVWLAGFVLFAASFLGGMYQGYSKEHKALITYQAKVEAAGQAQEAANKALEVQHQQQTEQIKNDYENRLAALRKQYYGSLFIDPVQGRVSIPAQGTPASSGFNAATPNQVPAGSQIVSPDLFAQQCMQTTLQLVELQNWVTEVSK